MMNVSFVLNSIALGVGLAMDAFSVCVANGLREPEMSWKKHFGMASVYAFFQFLMPMIGWFCVHAAAKRFRLFQQFIPLIALVLLSYIGGKMVSDGVQKQRMHKSSEQEAGEENPQENSPMGTALGTILVQGIATSIDALSVGFTISEYGPGMAFTASLLIAAVTFLICAAGVRLGRVFGSRLERWADFLGGFILIAIGIEIFISHFL